MKREQRIEILKEFGSQIINATRDQYGYPPEETFADRLEQQPEVSEEEKKDRETASRFIDSRIAEMREKKDKSISEEGIEEVAIEYLKSEYPEDYKLNQDEFWASVNAETIKDFTNGFKAALKELNL